MSLVQKTRFIVPIVTVALLLTWVWGVRAAEGDLIFIATYKNNQGGVSGLEGAREITISPDGSHIYAIATSGLNNDGSIAVFSRNSSSGALTFVESHTGDSGMRGANDLVVSPNGNFVYVASTTDKSIVTYSRNSVTGALTYVGATDSTNSTALPAEVASVDISADGLYLYTGGERRTTSWTVNPVTGAVATYGASNGGHSHGLTRVRISPDQQHVYLADVTDVIAYRRNPNGSLSFVQAIQEGVPTPLLDAPYGVQLSPDGLFVYVSAIQDDVISIFSRNTTSGELTYSSATPISGDARHLWMSPDGKFLLATDDNLNLRSFSRNAGTGALTLVDTATDGLNGVDGLANGHGVVISPDGNHVYTSARGDNAVTAFVLQGETVDLDYGDAPSSYLTLLSNDGARHTPSGAFLGSERDTESDGGPSSSADGDDNAGSPDDEDGVTFPSQAGFDKSGAVNIMNLTIGGAAAQYEVWIDWDQSGTFDSPSELAGSGSLGIGGGHAIGITVPGSAVLGTTYARVRVYNDGEALNSPSGLAGSGEVEDYQITVSESTFVDLLSFETSPNSDGSIAITWTTGSEVDTAGFHLWRYPESGVGEYTPTRITPSLILPDGSPLEGATYRYDDSPGYGQFLYRLEDFETDGTSEFHAATLVENIPRIFPPKVTGSEIHIQFTTHPEWDHFVEVGKFTDGGDMTWKTVAGGPTTMVTLVLKARHRQLRFFVFESIELSKCGRTGVHELHS